MHCPCSIVIHNSYSCKKQITQCCSWSHTCSVGKHRSINIVHAVLQLMAAAGKATASASRRPRSPEWMRHHYGRHPLAQVENQMGSHGRNSWAGKPVGLDSMLASHKSSLWGNWNWIRVNMHQRENRGLTKTTRMLEITSFDDAARVVYRGSRVIEILPGPEKRGL